MPNILGVDIGGVIFDFARVYKPGGVTDDEFLKTPIMDGALEYLSKLNKGIFNNSVFLVSKYNTAAHKELMREWLRRNDFFKSTGIPASHVYQCAERHEKAPIVKKLGVTHFVDDRAEVMSHFSDTVPHLYHFQSLLEDRNEWASQIPSLVFVESWAQLYDCLVLASQV